MDKIKQGELQGKIIDVRNLSEWREGVYEDAILLSLGKIKSEAHQRLNVNDLYYLHCKSGFRSWMAYCMFMKMGFNVINVKGGYMELVKCGLNPVIKEVS